MKINVFIIHLQGPPIEVSVYPQSTIQEMHENIQGLLKIDASQQILKYGGEYLSDPEATLGDYNIEDGDDIVVMQRLVNFFYINCSRQTLILNLAPKQKIKNQVIT